MPFASMVRSPCVGAAPGGDRDDLPALHDDGARVDHLAGADDDSRIRDGDVLRRHHARREQQSGEQTRDSELSLHRPHLVDGRGPLVDDDFPLFQHHLRLEHFVDVERRIAVDEDDVRQLAGLERADLIGHADIARGVRADDPVNVRHREHHAVRLQFVFEDDQVSGVLIGGVGDQLPGGVGIPDAAGVDEGVAALGAERAALLVAVGAGNRFRPGLGVAKASGVVLRPLHLGRRRRRPVDVGCAERNRAGDDRAGLGHALGLIVGREVLVRDVHQTSHAGVDGGDHRRTAHRVDVHLNADLLRLVHDRFEYFDLGSNTQR